MNKQRAAILSVISNSVLIVFKIIAGISMNSISVISEAIHSSLDLLASIIAFFSIKKAVIPEDNDHPFGHGKYENVSSFVEAILILIAAVLIIYESIKKIITGVQVDHIGSGVIVMLISSIVNLFISLSLFKISKKTNSLALEADAYHLLTDVFTSLGVFAGLILLKITGIKLLDPISAILVALLIIKTSVDLIKKSMVDLVDSSLPNEDIEKIIAVIKSYPEITNYHKLRTRKSGETVEIDVHLLIDGNTSLLNAHNLSNEIEEQVSSLFKSCYIVVHIEPETTDV